MDYFFEENKYLSDELAETKRKLEIAVKGLNDIKRTVDPIADESNWGIIVFLTIEQCLKDLGV
jgi:hypothetical protein